MKAMCKSQGCSGSDAMLPLSRPQKLKLGIVMPRQSLPLPKKANGLGRSLSKVPVTQEQGPEFNHTWKKPAVTEHSCYPSAGRQRQHTRKIKTVYLSSVTLVLALNITLKFKIIRMNFSKSVLFCL